MSNTLKAGSGNGPIPTNVAGDQPTAAIPGIGEDFVASTGSPFALSTAGVFPFIGFEPINPVVATSARPKVAIEGQGSSVDLFLNHEAHLRRPLEFASQLSHWSRSDGWRSFSNYLGGRIMYDGYSLMTIKRLMSSQAVAIKIRQLSLARLESMTDLPTGTDRQAKLRDLEAQFRETAWKIANEMVARMDSVAFLRFFGAAVNNVLVRMYHQGLHISLAEYQQFREVAEFAASKGQSLLMVPAHKSHIDYLSVSLLAYRLGLSIPHIVAGENLDMPIIGAWLKKCGAFFIRRNFQGDQLYAEVVKEYIYQLLESGMNIECFIEGTRSRTGKLLAPKLGIVKYVVEALQAGRTEDVWICPISIQYDRVIEAESYVNELLGTPKEKESLTGTIMNARLLQLKMGRIDVRFKKPFSLKNYLETETARRRALKPQPADNLSAPSLLSTTTSQPSFAAETTEDVKYASVSEKRDSTVLLQSLAYRIMSDINSVSVIMPAALVGSIMLTIRGRGVGRSELIRRVDTLRIMIEARGGQVAEFGGLSLEEIVDRALAVLSKLVGEHKDLIEPTFYPINRFELSFYRNQIIHLFVAESMLSAALYTSVKAGGAAPSQRMTRGRVTQEVAFLSRLMKNEFIYDINGLEANVKRTIDALEKDKVISVEDGGRLIGLADHERATGRENFDFYNFLLWPFIETYWLAAVSLFALTPVGHAPSSRLSVAWYAEKEFHKSVQLLGKSLYAQGDVSYLEAVNQATLSNAFQRLVELGVILTRRSPAAKSIPLLSLHPAWIPQRSTSGDIGTEGRLWEFLERLGRFRREGKNRRDNNTVSTRVFSSCSRIAPPVVEWSVRATAEAPESDFWAAKPSL